MTETHQFRPMPFYYDLELSLTADRVWVELSARHPIHGRAVWDAWGMLRPAGPCTDIYVKNLLWDACVDLLQRRDGHR